MSETEPLTENTAQDAPSPTAGPIAGAPSTAGLSPEARALLAELNMSPPSGDATAMQAEAIDGTSVPRAAATQVQRGDGLVLAPHQDAHAAAFADLLDHIEDSDGDMHVDEKSALAAVARFERQKQMPPQPSDMSDDLMLQADDADDTPDEVDTGVTLGADFDASINADFAALEAGGDDAPPATDDDGPNNLNADNFDADDFDADDFDADDFDADDFDLDLEDEKPSLMARLTGRGGSAVRRLVGFKDASSAYDAQSGASLLPYTIIRAVVLVLVAAVPPLVNLVVIQPQISDNNRKLTQIRSFEAKSQEDKKVADELAKKIARVQKSSKRRIAGLMPESEAQNLVNRYLEALQQFEVDLLAYNVSSDVQRKVIAGEEVQDATIVEMELVSRYDIYTDIRKIFVEQANNIIIVDEAFEAQPDSLKLRVNAKFMLPTYRKYDSELDTVVEKEEEEKK